MPVMLLEANECILFKHRAKLANINGELVVTTLRLCWMPSIPKEAEAFGTTWTNVKTMVFSPPTDPKVATKVDTVLGTGSQGKSLIFFLDGSDKDKELLRLKAEYKKLRKVSPATSAITATSSSSSSQAPAAGSSSQKWRSPAQALIDNHSDSSLAAAHLAQRKASLLQADHQLARSYKELVEVSQVVTADEFWALNVDPSLLEDRESQVLLQGRLTITDIIKQSTINSADGKLSVSLNQDDRNSIFESDASMRRAYAELVPLQKSDKEFWEMYLEKWTCGASAQSDELFSRFEEKRDDGASSSSGSGTSNRANGSRDFLNSLDLDFDLMTNYGDYHTSEQVASEDRLYVGRRELEMLNSESRRVMMPLRDNRAAGGGAGVIGASGAELGAAAGAGRKRKSDALTTEFSELNQEKAPQYAPLTLRRRDLATIGDDGKQETASGGGAFGKASSAVSRGVSRRPVAPLLSSRAIVAALPSAFPTVERACTLYALDRTTLRTATHAPAVANKAWAEHLGAFKQEMLEAFIEVTDLLRHFFAVTGREGCGAPTQGSETAAKVQKIVDRLLVRKEGLQHRARSIKDSIKDAPRKYTEAEIEACCGIIGDIARLVTRAQDWWTLYQG